MAQAANDATPRKLLKKHRIYFDLNERRAPGHEELFGKIKKLGEYDINKYHSDITFESRQKPWRRDILEQANLISAIARKCHAMHKNEASWRLSLESYILARFSVEIVWSGGGLNQLFDDRAEEEVQHDSGIRNILKAGRKPDRMIGLRVTPKLDKILNRTEGPEGYTIGDSITTCPLKDNCEPLLFPFLVLEAKSEKSSNPFSKINLQTGFAINAMLKLQRNLFNASIENRQAAMMPLVWFLANKGEIWRISGAYVEETEVKSEPNFRVLELWEGNIRYEEQALRLLLIIDHIFDWARDAYRKDIIDNLRSLAKNPTPSLADDSDVYSTTGRFLDSDDISLSEPRSDNLLEQTQHFSVPQLLNFFDNYELAFRDANYMCYRFCAFYVTLENLDKFLYSVRSMKEAQLLARRLWKGIVGTNTWCVTAECLNAVEKLWTNQNRQLQFSQDPEEPFLACFEMKSYLSNDKPVSLSSKMRIGQWDQIHQLSYIAIARNALEKLREKTEFRPHYVQMRFQNCPEVPQERVITLFEQIRFTPMKKCFAAAVSRARLCSFASRSSHGKQYACKGILGERYFEPSLSQKNTTKCKAAELPWVMYKHLKVGMKEPSESFLRVSKQSGELDVNKNGPNLVGSWTNWDSKLQDFNAVLVAGVDTPDVENRGSGDCVSYCVFVLGRPSMITNDNENDGIVKAKIYPEILLAFLNIRSSQLYNFPYNLWQSSNDFEKALRNLEDMSNRCQVVQSLDCVVSESQLVTLVLDKDVLGSWGRLKWQDDFQDVVNNINQHGKIYGLGQTLHYLLLAFKKVSEERMDGSRPLNAIDIAAELRSASLISLVKGYSTCNQNIEDETATARTNAADPALFQPSSNEPWEADSPELGIFDQKAESVNYKRKQTYTSPRVNARNLEESFGKKRRLQENQDVL